ncbi:aldehyde dehydrogenase family protein [Paeniroseomonas aquatica]|uniref:aldehyde dehydrogenase family protein n=1 Tax=Paeniroseomonas aquatica TaxID=373043 RepID=UPI00361A403E
MHRPGHRPAGRPRPGRLPRGLPRGRTGPARDGGGERSPGGAPRRPAGRGDRDPARRRRRRPAPCPGDRRGAPGHPLHATEIFGPALALVPVPDLAAAIAWIALRPAPLAIYLFGANRTEAAIVAAGTRSGAIVEGRCIEYAAFPALAFGGVGASGFGRRNGEAGFLAFSNLRARVEHGPWSLSRLLDPPRDAGARALVRRILR